MDASSLDESGSTLSESMHLSRRRDNDFTNYGDEERHEKGEKWYNKDEVGRIPLFYGSSLSIHVTVFIILNVC